MQSWIRHGTMAVALVGGLFGGLVASLGAAFAQAGSDRPQIQEGPAIDDRVNMQLKLTGPQRQAIAEAVRKANNPSNPPPNFVVSIGAPVPPAIELYVLPDGALAQVPAAKQVKYTIVQNQLILVDPTTMRVVDILPQ